MTDNPYIDRKLLTFEQAEGLVPIPTQLASKEISPQLRAMLWNVIFTHLDHAKKFSSMGGPGWLADPWNAILKRHHIFRLFNLVDEYDNNPRVIFDVVKRIVTTGEYQDALGFIQFILRDSQCPQNFCAHITTALIEGHAAYRVLDRDTIIPISSEEEQATLTKAFADLATREFHGARSHLKKSGENLTNGSYAESIKESIHAVESVARILETSGSFNGALTRLQRSAYIHPSLSLGFQKIYGYTSDEKGIRHPLLEEPSKVDEVDALFMIGGCASFVSYLINKSRQAGLLPSQTANSLR